MKRQKLPTEAEVDAVKELFKDSWHNSTINDEFDDLSILKHNLSLLDSIISIELAEFEEEGYMEFDWDEDEEELVSQTPLDIIQLESSKKVIGYLREAAIECEKNNNDFQLNYTILLAKEAFPGIRF